VGGKSRIEGREPIPAAPFSIGTGRMHPIPGLVRTGAPLLGYNPVVKPTPFRLAAVLALCLCAVTGTAQAQFFFIDVNGDGRPDASDVLHSGITSVDLYLDTSQAADGSPVACGSPGHGGSVEPFTISSYTFILGWEPAGGGSLTYGPWTDNLGFTISAGGTTGGRIFWTARAAPYYLAPGTYKLGTMAVTVTGTPVLHFLSSTDIDSAAITSFGSQCSGRDFDNTIKLGSDFTDARGTATGDDAPRTVWRTVRDLYR